MIFILVIPNNMLIQLELVVVKQYNVVYYVSEKSGFMESIENCEKWYDINYSMYNSCGQTLKNLIEKILNTNEIPFHSINYRIKTKTSFIEKCKKDKYDDPISQITDVCGLRIIGYTNHDIKMIQSIIENEFKIDSQNSIDKSKIMKDDQVGYLSIHYVASIKPNRTELTEYKEYRNIKFEIQLRTLLQHAWAEIEHDRNYKFSGELPSEIKRRFYLVAGSLELLDREFEQISQDIDTYAKTIREETEKGNLDEVINSTSLTEFLSIKFRDFDIKDRTFNGADKEIISELFLFDIKTLKDLDNILSEELLKTIKINFNSSNYLGLLRDIMIVYDVEKYFEKAWQENWTGMSYDSYNKFLAVCPDIKKYIGYFTLHDINQITNYGNY